MSALLQTARHLRAIGLVRPRRRLPRQVLPTLIEREYSARLLRYVAYARVAFEPLLRALPELMASAQRDRERTDADEGAEILKLIAEATARLGAAVSTQEIEELAKQFGARTAQHNRVQLGRQVQSAIGVDVVGSDRALPGIIDGFVAENVALIKDIPATLAADIAKATTRAVASGTLAKDLQTEISERFGVAENRAKVIARDQIGKLYGQVNASRQRDLGVTHYIWRTAHDRRVRGTPGGLYPKATPSHFARDGKTFEYANPPPGGIPGHAIMCRCYAEPSFENILDQL